MNPASLKTVQKWGVVLATIALLAARGRESPEPEKAPAVPETVTSSDGVPISYGAHGTGPVVLVFIHGWSCGPKLLGGTVGAVLPVVAVDLAGHGESGLGREGWTIEAFGGDVAAVVEELGLERLFLSDLRSNISRAGPPPLRSFDASSRLSGG